LGITTNPGISPKERRIAMQRYLGIDVHKASCSMCVLSDSGRRIHQEVVETNGQTLVRYAQNLSGSVSVCIEEGEWSGWLWEIMSPHVASFTVVRGRKRRRGSKSDAQDAYALAERIRTGQVGEKIFKAPHRYTKLRELAQVYSLVAQDLARGKNRLKSRFRRRGISCPGASIYGTEERRKKLLELPSAMRPAVELLGCQLEFLQELRKAAEEAMVTESHRHRVSRRLETIPGLGPIRVAQMLPIVVTPHRFPSKRRFWSYCGLGIKTFSSGDWVREDGKWVRGQRVQTRGLNRNSNRVLKSIFKGAAITITSHSRPNSFRKAYDRLLEEGTRPNLAQLTVARKVAATTLAIWRSKEVYDPDR